METWRVGSVVCETRMTKLRRYVEESQFLCTFVICDLCPVTLRHLVQNAAEFRVLCLSPAATDVIFLPEELTVNQLFASFPIIYGTPSFISNFTVLKRAVPYSVTNKSTPRPVFIRFNLWLSVLPNPSPKHFLIIKHVSYPFESCLVRSKPPSSSLIK